MVIERGQFAEAERLEFEQVVRSCGREPKEFRIEVFVVADGSALRKVHVTCGRTFGQYEASRGRGWTRRFAEHLACGRFR